jgi:hypothetical protein
MNPTIPTRPKYSDPAIIEAVAHRLAPCVHQWNPSDSDEEDIGADLIKLLQGTHDYDGYKLARELEQYQHYDSDAMLVDILDSTSHLFHEELAKASKAWVEEHLPPEPPAGARVYQKGMEEKNGIGIVTRNYPDGRSTVNFAQLGHITEGTGTHGLVLEWEKLEMLP